MIVRYETIHYGRYRHETIFADGKDIGEAEANLTAKIGDRVEHVQSALGCLLLATFLATLISGFVAHTLLGVGALGISMVVLYIVAIIGGPASMLATQSDEWCKKLRKRRQRVYGAVHMEPEWTLRQ